YELRDILGNDSVLLRNQFRRSPTHTRTLNIRTSFDHQIGNMNVGAYYSLNLSRSRSLTSTYDLTPFFASTPDMPASWLPDAYENAYIDSLSNHTNSNTLSHLLQLRCYYYIKGVNINASMGFTPTRQSLDQKTGLVTADTVRHSVEYTPSVSIYYYSDKYRFSFSYRGSTRQPQLSDLLTLTDNSNPLYITRGNPDLSPSYQQDIDVTFEMNKTGLSLRSYWNNTYNSVTRATTYNLTTGGIETRPVNINGNWRLDNSANYHTRLGRRFSVSSEWSVNFSRYVALMNEGNQSEPSQSITLGRALKGELRGDYSPAWGSMNLTGTWTHDYSHNLLRGQRNYVRSYSITYDTFVELPADIQLKSDISYSWRNGSYITPGEDDQLLWNLEASWRFLSKRQATLKVQWLDILSRSKNFSRVVTATRIREDYNRVIGSYFLATVSYNFNFK
ncbi:MAG: outer membrane beta-barrel family protein, partial [Duncaniella sp.]|nr:outer membrane beta-barrel family protein [Duncaniella sp.]